MPAAAKPTVVEPTELMAIRELAADSSSSVASSGSTLASAESKNCVIALLSATITYNQAMLTGTRNGIRKTAMARSKSEACRIRFRS